MRNLAEGWSWIIKGLTAVGFVTKKESPQANSDEKPDLHIEIKPDLTKFIVSLGYTTEQGKAFAEGYTAKLLTLNDRCMVAGFSAAAIDEEEALGRFNRALGLYNERKLGNGVTKIR